MKGSVLWRRITSRYGARLHARGRIGQAGAAMVMALLFILIVTMTSMLLLGVLISQTVPYLKNSQYSQAGYAAESGLQTALSFLRSADKSGDASGLFPAAATGSTANASFQTVGNAVIVKNVEVPQTSGTVTSYTPQKVSYGLKITYYDGDPSGASTTASSERTASSSTGTTVATAADTGTGTVKQITTSADATSITYAVVVAYGYVVGSDGTFSYGTTTPVRTMSGIYKFGWTAASSSAGNTVSVTDNTFFYGLMRDKMSSWGILDTDSLKADDTGNTEQYSFWNANGYGEATIADPRYQFCAVTDDITEGSQIHIYRRAYTIDSAQDQQSGKYQWRTYTTIKYSSYCSGSGDYSKLNSWVYQSDDSIRLASDTSWCITGSNSPSTSVSLQKCATESYSPKSGNSQTVFKGDQGYSLDAERSNTNSLLNHNQKWAFYPDIGFINARYASYSQSGQTFTDSDTAQRLYVPLVDQGQNAAIFSVCSGADGDQQSKDGAAQQCSLESTWVSGTTIKSNLYDGRGGYDTITTYYRSSASAGESGWQTHQVVTSGGLCLSISPNITPTVSTCIVDAAPVSANCSLKTDCGSPTYIHPQYVDYTQGEDGSTGVETTLTSTHANGETYWDSRAGVTRPVVYCFVSGGSSVGSIVSLQSQQNSCPETGSAYSKFYRTENVGKNSIYNYKFVLAKSVNYNPDVSQWDDGTALCLTAVSSDMSTYDLSKSINQGTRQAYIALQTCSLSTTGNLGQTIYPQIWNGPTPGSSDGSGGSSGGSGTGGGTGADMTPGSGANGFLVTKELSTSAVG